MRIEPTDNINDVWTVERFEKHFEGMPYEAGDPSMDHIICDFCSTGVSYASKPRVGVYVADNVLNPEHPAWRQRTNQHVLAPLAVHCPDCAVHMLYFPCEGFGEVKAFFGLDEDRVWKNVKVADVSPPDDGIPWDPKELSERITGTSWEERSLMAMLGAGHELLWGPEDMITFFLAVVEGVDPRQLIRYDGSFDPRELGRARKSWEAFTRKMGRDGPSRRKFRDHVRGRD